MGEEVVVPDGVAEETADGFGFEDAEDEDAVGRAADGVEGDGGELDEAEGEVWVPLKSLSCGWWRSSSGMWVRGGYGDGMRRPLEMRGMTQLRQGNACEERERQGNGNQGNAGRERGRQGNGGQGNAGRVEEGAGEYGEKSGCEVAGVKAGPGGHGVAMRRVADEVRGLCGREGW